MQFRLILVHILTRVCKDPLALRYPPQHEYLMRSQLWYPHGKNRRLVADEPVEVGDLRRNTDDFRGIYRMYLNWMKASKPEDVVHGETMCTRPRPKTSRHAMWASSCPCNMWQIIASSFSRPLRIVIIGFPAAFLSSSALSAWKIELTSWDCVIVAIWNRIHTPWVMWLLRLEIDDTPRYLCGWSDLKSNSHHELKPNSHHKHHMLSPWVWLVKWVRMCVAISLRGKCVDCVMLECN